VSDVRQTEIHTAEPLVPEPNAFEVEMATEKLKTHKSSGTDQIPADLINAGGRTICCEVHKCVNSIWNKEELPEDCKESIIVPIYENGGEIDCNCRGISVLLIHTHFVQHPAVKANTICRGIYLSIWISMQQINY
jgi:hypothetical protein